MTPARQPPPLSPRTTISVELLVVLAAILVPGFGAMLYLREEIVTNRERTNQNTAAIERLTATMDKLTEALSKSK